MKMINYLLHIVTIVVFFSFAWSDVAEGKQLTAFLWIMLAFWNLAVLRENYRAGRTAYSRGEEA